jgi:hypothetical protein
MSGGKASGKQRRDTAPQDALLQLQALHHTHREATRLFLVAARQGATDSQIAHALRQGLPHLTDPASLHDSRAGKQAEGTGATEEGKQPMQKKRLLLRSLPRPALLAPDAFAAALGAIPAEDWCRTWAAGRTIMLRRTSKRVKELVDKMRLPAVVRLSRSFWGDARNGTAGEKRQVVMRQLTALTAQCRISTLALSRCDMKGQDAERLAGVLAQCPGLAHLDLSANLNLRAAGAERIAGVLGQCRELVHLNVSHNGIGAGGAERLAGVLGRCRELAHLNLCNNDIGQGGAASLGGLAQCPALAYLVLSHNWIRAAGAERLAGVLAQCTALVYLDVSFNYFGPAGAQSLASVLGQCTALAHLDLSDNMLGPSGAESLAVHSADRTSWSSESSRSAGAVLIAGSPQSMQKSDRTCRDRVPGRSARAVHSADSPRFQHQ